MKRSASVIALLLAAALTVGVYVSRCIGPQGRAQEACLKDAIFCVQRATHQVASAEDYAAVLKARDALQKETARLRELRAEFAAMPEPSRWERSRMRKHRPLADSALYAWTEVEKDFRERINEGLPPHVRLQLTAVVDDVAAARAETWDAMTIYWD